MSIQFTCPGCKQQLAVPDEARGAVIRCPACSTTFSSERGIIEPPDTAIQAPAPPVPSMGPGPGYTEVASDKAELARGSGEHRDDQRRDIRWDDGDPLSIRRKKSGAPVLFVFGGLLAFLLVVVVITAFVWPGFLRGGKDGFAGEGRHDLLSLAPADSLLLLEMAMPKGFEPWMMDQFKQQLAKNGGPASLADLLADAERFMMAGEFSKEMPTFVAALLTKKPYDKDKIMKDLEMGPARAVQGLTIHTIKVRDVKVPITEIYVAMPDARVLVVGVMPEADFVKVLANQGKPALLPADMLARARQLEGNDLWVLLANQGIIKKKLQEANLKEVPFVGDSFAVLQRCKTVSLVYRVVKKDFRIELSVDCADQADATKFQKLVQSAWEGAKILVNQWTQMEPKAQPLVNDLNQTFKVEQRTTVVTTSVVISEKTMKDAEKLVPQNNLAPRR